MVGVIRLSHTMSICPAGTTAQPILLLLLTGDDRAVAIAPDCLRIGGRHPDGECISAAIAMHPEHRLATDRAA